MLLGPWWKYLITIEAAKSDVTTEGWVIGILNISICYTIGKLIEFLTYKIAGYSVVIITNIFWLSLPFYILAFMFRGIYFTTSFMAVLTALVTGVFYDMDFPHWILAALAIIYGPIMGLIYGIISAFVLG